MEDFPSLYWEELDKRTKDIGLPVTPLDRKEAMKSAASRVKENIDKGDYQQFILYPPNIKRIRELKMLVKL